MKFLEIRYIAYVEDSREIFDYSKNSVIVPVGKGLLYRFLEEALKTVEPGKSYRFLFKRPFGERKEDLLKIVPYSEFVKRGIRPMPGMIVSIDGKQGIIRTVSGRVIVDFNHPFAGKNLVYEIEVIREITDLAEKVKGTFEFLFGLPRDLLEVKEEEGKVVLIPKDERINITKDHIELVKRIIDDLSSKEVTVESSKENHNGSNNDQNQKGSNENVQAQKDLNGKSQAN